MTSFVIPVLYESKGVIVIEKPTGLLVEAHWKFPSVETWVKNYLSKQYKHPFVGIVHRLDRMVSGVVVVAKKRSALRHLNEQISKGRMGKRYFALTLNRPLLVEGVLSNYISRSADRKKALVTDVNSKTAKKAILKYRIEERNEGYLWDIKLITGRYHQIRVQLANEGCPILGDMMYGSSKKEEQVGIALHCYQMKFEDPGRSKKIKINSRVSSNPILKKYLDNFR